MTIRKKCYVLEQVKPVKLNSLEMIITWFLFHHHWLLFLGQMCQQKHPTWWNKQTWHVLEVGCKSRYNRTAIKHITMWGFSIGIVVPNIRTNSKNFWELVRKLDNFTIKKESDFLLEQAQVPGSETGGSGATPPLWLYGFKRRANNF